jgi:hypothetical protein
MIAEAEQAQKAEPTARIFISYSRKDMPFADRLEAALKSRGDSVTLAVVLSPFQSVFCFAA